MTSDLTDRGSPLGASSRALLDAARPGLSPDAEAARRMRAKIAASVAGTAVGGASVKTALATKLGLTSLVAVVIVGASFFALRHESADVVAPVRSVAPIAATSDVEPVIATSPTGPTRPTTPTLTVDQDVSAVEMINAKPRRPAAARALGPDTGQKPATPLAREVELIDRAMAALRKGDARGALVAIHDYDTETVGNGQLAEDAAAIQVEALCAVKDPTAVTKLATFDQRYPRSAQRSRLNDACTR